MRMMNSFIVALCFFEATLGQMIKHGGGLNNGNGQPAFSGPSDIPVVSTGDIFVEEPVLTLPSGLPTASSTVVTAIVTTPSALPLTSALSVSVPSVLANTVPSVTNTPAQQTKQIFAPPKLSRRHSQAASSICQTPQFALTNENWIDSDAAGFLRRWALDFIGDPEYSRRGLISSLAHSFLGRNEFQCTMRSSHSCMVTCNEVVSMVTDPSEARALYFVMTAARHYLEIMEVADHALLAAQVNVGQWTDVMAQKFYWTQETSHDRVFRTTISLMTSFVSFMMFTFAPQIPFHAVEKIFEMKYKEAPDNAVAPVGAALDKVQLDQANQKADMETNAATAGAAAKWVEVGYNAIGNGVPIIGVQAMEFMTWEGYEKAQALNIAELGLAVSQMVSEARSKNAQGVMEAFSGRVTDGTGNTILGSILESGSFLAVNSQMLHQWSGAQVEKRLTDALKFRILSEAMKSQGVYIHCTQKLNAFSCEHEDSGPQNLKACVGDRVCYMNKWSGRGYWWRHHVEEPFGANQMADWPFLVTTEEIIISSVKTHLMTKGGADMARFASQEDTVSPQNFLDASTPGAFFIPVCINDRFAQNTPLDDYKLWDNFNQNSEKKTLPCSCGEFWGDETERLWLDTGLAMSKHQEKYRGDFCPRQLTKKLGEDKLERYVADCRLRVSRSGMLNGYHDGKHPFCDVVIDLVTKHGKSPEDMDPYLKLALECKVGLHRTRLGKPKKECEMYSKTGFEELVSQSHPRARLWFGGA